MPFDDSEHLPTSYRDGTVTHSALDGNDRQTHAPLFIDVTVWGRGTVGQFHTLYPAPDPLPGAPSGELTSSNGHNDQQCGGGAMVDGIIMGGGIAYEADVPASADLCAILVKSFAAAAAKLPVPAHVDVSVAH
jgi:hypothetical protein